MKQYTARYMRFFETSFMAEDITAAQVQARLVESQFANNSCKLVSLTAKDYVAPPEKDPKPIVEFTPEAKAIAAELARPRWPGGIDDLDIA